MDTHACRREERYGGRRKPVNSCLTASVDGSCDSDITSTTGFFFHTFALISTQILALYSLALQAENNETHLVDDIQLADVVLDIALLIERTAMRTVCTSWWEHFLKALFNSFIVRRLTGR